MDFPWVGVVFWLGVFGWFSITVWARYLRDRERQQTLRTFAERGQPLDPDMLGKLLPVSEVPADQRSNSPTSIARGLMVGGIVTAFVSVGLLIAAQFFGQIDDEARLGVSGAAAIVGFAGLGLLTAAFIMRRHIVADRKALDQVGTGA